MPGQSGQRAAEVTSEAVLEALRQCYDPCCQDKGISVVDMGLIEDVRVAGPDVHISMTLTTGWCPFSLHLFTLLEERVGQLPGVGHVEVKVVWEPAWTPARLSESARKKLSLPLEQLMPLREQRLKEVKP